MFSLTRFIPTFSTILQRPNCLALLPRAGYHCIVRGVEAPPAVAPGGLFTTTVRNVIRCHFPRPSERKRIKRHGYWHRMSTPNGRKILMRRILKGRHVLAH